MAAKTRSEIRALIESHTGHTKTDLENSAMDDALKVGLVEHPFRDAQSEPSDIVITEDSVSVTLVTSDIIDIVTARIVEADGTRNMLLKLKTRTWWDKNVINPEDNMKGWPEFGLRWGSTIKLDRPASAGIELRLRVTTEQTFASDSTVCPIYILDKFIEQYATAQVYAELENWDSYHRWLAMACGSNWLAQGKVGGSLKRAIETDGVGDTALDIAASGDASGVNKCGVSVKNLVTGHDDYGNTRWWV